MLSCSPRDAVGEVVGALDEFCCLVKSSEFSFFGVRFRGWRRFRDYDMSSSSLNEEDTMKMHQFRRELELK